MIIKIYVAVVTIVHLLGYFWLARWTVNDKEVDGAKIGEEMTHTWDETLSEYNNPLPGWWLIMFYLSIVFAFIYFVLYPGLWDGILGWNDAERYERQSEQFEQKANEYLSQFKGMSIEELSKNQAAVDTGRRLFLHNCAVCHGSDGGGATGYPNLTDNDWLWGGTPDNILATITNGKTGTMTPYGTLSPELRTPENVEAIAHYALSLSSKSGFDAALAEKGKPLFEQGCAAGCHQVDGTGVMNLGTTKLHLAANLTDDVWLHTLDPDVEFIKQQIVNPQNGEMPAWGGEPGTPQKGLGQPLGADRVKILAAYVYQLSR